ncbi:2Fe-2S iron-sulfur cluster-binding protein [Bacillus litorisediminis]|uniref:2Fe-2S iron-sulfur cluster-binding protein n=1 Tax=Bacillus litorisediminis TaxID=2922713 RepID=UPI001FAFACF4|nr:2Fe-2S iron-sulfur cluster-binding protein [Bacillus litorisediminis]
MSTIQLNVLRGDKDQGSTMVHYEIPFEEGMSLLDALFWIRENMDSSLAVRYSCRSANACKECMALVDGKAGYLCSMRAKEGTTLTLEPLKGRPWVRDLTTAIE